MIDQVHSYTPLKQLAKSMYGDIQLASDNLTQHHVVMKRVKLGLAKRKISIHGVKCEEDIIAEIKALKTLQKNKVHQHIVHLKGQYVQEGTLNLIYEYCEGGDLYQLVEELNRPLSEQEALNYFKQIVSGVDYLHQHGIAHRDLSLENILMSNNTCKVADFGLSTTSSVCSDCVGKPFYMAPEVVNTRESGNQSYDPFKTDMWSLGIIFFILVSGNPLFTIASKHDKNYQYFQRHGLDEMKDYFGLDHLTPFTYKILKKLIVDDPNDRWTISELSSYLSML